MGLAHSPVITVAEQLTSVDPPPCNSRIEYKRTLISSSLSLIRTTAGCGSTYNITPTVP